MKSNLNQCGLTRAMWSCKVLQSGLYLQSSRSVPTLLRNSYISNKESSIAQQNGHSFSLYMLKMGATLVSIALWLVLAHIPVCQFKARSLSLSWRLYSSVVQVATVEGHLYKRDLVIASSATLPPGWRSIGCYLWVIIAIQIWVQKKKINKK